MIDKPSIKVFVTIAFFTFLLSDKVSAQSHATIKEPVYDVRKFGAKGSGKTNDQKAIQAAIDQCNRLAVLITENVAIVDAQ